MHSLIADFHVHSRFSRATSKNLNLSEMYKWGKLRGINVLGTGDFTHPQWFEEISTQLVACEDGLFELKSDKAKLVDELLPRKIVDNKLRFVLSVEISNIYKRHGKVRRLHNVVVMPSLESVAKLNSKLTAIGNLHSDGRPILGLDSEELLKIVMDIDSQAWFIPAHIWTPWFAMFGSKSGFDSVEEAFGDSRKMITALETGLSADIKMCRQIADLDEYALVSNSDAHSAAKLGREATIFNCEMELGKMKEALINQSAGLVGTIEFYPEEGKYHMDGHAPCAVRLSHEETIKLDGRCPKCGGVITVGVLARVDDLRKIHAGKPRKIVEKSSHYIVPLDEIIAESLGSRVGSKKVSEKYFELVNSLGSDFDLLLNTEIEEIRKSGYREIARAIDNMRQGKTKVEPGYDGIFGKISLLGDGGSDGQTSFL